MTTEETDTEPPVLDEETSRLLVEHMRLKVYEHASVCEADIWHDLHIAAHAAREKGRTPKQAARQKVPARYLRASEEEWLRTFNPKGGHSSEVKHRAQHVFILTIGVGIIAIATMLSDKDFGRIIVALYIVCILPFAIGYVALPYLKMKLVEAMGPMGCALLPPETPRAFYYLLGLGIGVIVLSIVQSLLVLVFMAFWLVNVIDVAWSYFRYRKRIKLNYRYVEQILGIPDV